MILNNLKIYCSYHNKKQFDEYNLYNSDILKSYWLLDKNIFESYLIDNNSKLRELQMMLYIYEHNIKSKYIGFCHYRRHWNFIDFETLDKNHTCCYISCTYDKSMYDRSNILNDYDLKRYSHNKENIIKLHKFYYSKLDEYINIKYNKLINKYNKITYSNSCIVHHREMFITTWNIFSKMMKFIQGYLYFTFGDKLCNIKEILNQYATNKTNSYIGRSLSLFLEDLVSISINLFDNSNKTFNVFYKDNIDAFLIYTGKENLNKWILKQYSLGIKNIVIFNETDKDIEYLNNPKYNYNYQECFFINKSYNEFNNVFEIYGYVDKQFHKYYAAPKYYVILKNEEYLNSNEIIQYKNELWNNLDISNEKIKRVT